MKQKIAGWIARFRIPILIVMLLILTLLPALLALCDRWAV